MRVGYDNLIDGMASRAMAWQGKAAGMFALVVGKYRCGCVYDKSRGVLLPRTPRQTCVGGGGQWVGFEVI